MSAPDVRFHAEIIDALLDALGITEGASEAEVVTLLDGCTCDAGEGAKHLIWHLGQKRARLAGIEALANEWEIGDSRVSLLAARRLRAALLPDPLADGQPS